MSKKEIVLGQVSSYTTFPTEVTVENQMFFLTKDEEEYKLFSKICPHAGGQVLDYGNEFVCPIHFWSFDKKTGACTNIPGAELHTIPVQVKEGNLVVEI